MAAGSDFDRCSRRLVDHRRHRDPARGRRGRGFVRTHRQGGVRQRRAVQRHAGPGHAADPGRPGLCARLPHAAVEHRRRGTVLPGRMGRQCDRPHAGDLRDGPAMAHARHHGPCRVRLRRGLGLHPRLPQGQVERQRDHHDADAELHRHVVGALLGVRRVERGRVPDVTPVPQERLAAPPHRLRQPIQGLCRLDAARGHPVRADRGGRCLVHHLPQPLGLRIPADRRQPTGPRSTRA